MYSLFQVMAKENLEKTVLAHVQIVNFLTAATNSVVSMNWLHQICFINAMQNAVSYKNYETKSMIEIVVY